MFVGDIENDLKAVVIDICRRYGYWLLNIEVMPDHLHLFVSAVPGVSPLDIVKTIKSVSAVELFRRYPGFKRKCFWGSGLWSKGYYVGTAGTVTAETIQLYIDEQKTKG